MKIADHLRDVARLFLDTAPLVYYVEEQARYLALVEPVFERLDRGDFMAVTSPVTLAECLVVPYRDGRLDIGREFAALILNGANTSFVVIDRDVADRAAELRARYNLNLPDAFQVSVALAAGCDAFLTNDATLKRVIELRVIVLDEVDT